MSARRMTGIAILLGLAAFVFAAQCYAFGTVLGVLAGWAIAALFMSLVFVAVNLIDDQ